MRNTVFIPILSFILSFNMACTSSDKAPSDAPQEASVLHFSPHTFKKQSKVCRDGSGACATVQASYLQAQGGDPAIMRRINDTLIYYVKTALAVYAVSKEEVLVPLDSIAETFIQGYEQLKRDNPSYNIPWEVETNMKITFQSSKVFSIELQTYSYTGAAHPYAFSILLVIDKQSGNKLEWSDLIGDLPAFEHIAERHFRATNNIPEGSPLNKAGYFWDQPFGIPKNFALSDSGLYCLYNTYDIAPYAMGATEFTIPYADLKGILNETLIY